MKDRELTLSIRLMWPFLRLLANEPDMIARHQAVGLGPEQLGNPETRIPHRVVMFLLEQSIASIGDPTLGLRAGASRDPADGDVLEHAARTCATLGEGFECLIKFFRIMNEAAELSLVPEGDLVSFRFRVTDGVRQPSAANDYVVASSLEFARRNAATQEPPVEIRLAHDRPAYAAEYEKAFPGVPVRFGFPYNAIVFRKERLAVPMLRANPRVSAAFQLHAQQMLDRLRRTDTTVGRVREEINTQLAAGTVSMRTTAKHMAMSVATLRRRLEAEGATFAGIVDEMRRELSMRYLNERGLTVSEVAFLLGFSSGAAFHRAFRRWNGASPAEFRSRLWAQ
ncbi:MAG TPA: AraC family transcriptional regulator [Polyangiaceae bacterium]|nr:AraC family transcriptional regulator [Polyangiaceae bacterium]